MNKNKGCKFNGNICPNCSKTHKDFTGGNNNSSSIMVRKKLSKINIGSKNPMYKIPPWNKGLTKETDERVKKYTEIRNKTVNSVEWKNNQGKKIGIINRAKRQGKKYEEIYLNKTKNECDNIRIKIKKSMIGKNIGKHSDSHIKKNSEAKIKLWQNEEYRKRMIKAILKGLMKRPTSFEQKIINLCKKYNLPFDYVGNGKVIINYVNPDFINNNGKKQIIEVYHDYFKIKGFGSCENYENQRRKRFAKFGFKTLFLRTEDIERKDWELNCLNKINNFNEVK